MFIPGGSGEERVSLPLPASRSHPHSPWFTAPSSICKASSVGLSLSRAAAFLILSCPASLPLVRTFVCGYTEPAWVTQEKVSNSGLANLVPFCRKSLTESQVQGIRAWAFCRWWGVFLCLLWAHTKKSTSGPCLLPELPQVWG